MVVATYVVEASTLIDTIHELKQWVYDGSIRIHVPLCALDRVEAAYKASLVPKEVQKEAAAKKPSGRAARKEQPLFDINPRTAREYLSRAQSEKGEEGVKLQSSEEYFTQWKEEEKEAVKPESPPPAPSSFADALLRKLNIRDDSNSAGSKGSSKPRLVAKANEPKSPWKYHKIPNVPSKGIPTTLKSLFSCVLWCLHEFENNPLMPETFVLLVDDPESTALAERLNIPATSSAALRTSILELKASQDHRLDKGQLEADFPAFTHEINTEAKNTLTNGDHLSTNGVDQVNAESILKDNHEDSKSRDDVGPPMLSSEEHEVSIEVHKPEQAPVEAGPEPDDQHDANSGILQDIQDSSVREQSFEETVMAADSQEKRSPNTSPKLLAVEDVGKCQASYADVSELKAVPSSATKPMDSPESEVDSDEEIIVFNPRARRVSGAPRKSTDVTRSRPTTANGPPSQKLADLHEAPIEPSQSRQPTARDHPPQQNTMLKPRPQIESTLKPQSPVFTPGQTYIPSQAQVLETKSPIGTFKTMELAPNQETAVEALHKDDAQEADLHPTPPPRHPRAALQQKHPSQEQLHLQRQSERIIQRQRELIQRQTKVSEKTVQTPQPPRQIQMEPTTNPTVIDPNDFDRSYVVQPLVNTSEASGSKRRSAGHRRRSPKNGSKESSKDGPKDAPKDAPKTSPRRSPKREIKRQEADVDFVLKSGAPRGSTRGRGKLWIP